MTCPASGVRSMASLESPHWFVMNLDALQCARQFGHPFAMYYAPLTLPSPLGRGCREETLCDPSQACRRVRRVGQADG